MIDVLELFEKNKTIQEVLSSLKEDSYTYFVNGVTENHQYLLTYATYLQSGCFVVYVASNVYKANLAYDAFCKLAGYENVNLYLTDEIISSELVAVSGQFKKERINTIKSIITNTPKIIVTHVLGCLKPCVIKEEYTKYIKHIKKGETIDVNKFINELVHLGYKKMPITSVEGEFSVRGEVIDLYGACFSNPIRINLFDDEIEKIRYFDKDTQRSIEEISEIDLLPLNEVVLTSDDIDRFESSLSVFNNIDMVNRDINDIINYENIDRINKYLNILYDKSVSFLDYLDDDRPYRAKNFCSKIV